MRRYFRLDKNTEAGEKLVEFFERCHQVNQQCFELARTVGATGDGPILQSSNYAAGSIVGFKLDTMPEGWRKASKNHYGYYFPKASKENKKLLKQIYDIPMIHRRDLDLALGFKAVGSSPGITEGQTYFLIEVPVGGFAVDYTALPEMEELTGGYYIKLQEELKVEEKKGGEQK